MMVMGNMIDRNARLFPQKEAFVHNEQRITFREFRDRVNKLINSLLSHGVAKGERVAVLSTNSIPYFELYGAADKGGFILVPLNFRLAARELLHLIQDSEAATLFVEHKYVPTIESIKDQLTGVKRFICIDGEVPGMLNYEALLEKASAGEPVVTVHEDDPVYIVYTSGTTGIPRGAVLTHRGQCQTANALALEMGLRIVDKTLDMMPLYHTGGHAVAQAHFYRGCTNVITGGFNPQDAIRLVETEKITTMQVVPAMIVDMLNQPDIERYDMSSLRMIFYASSPMPVSLLKRAIQRWGNIFFQCYGLTENGPVATALAIEDHVVDGPDQLTRRLASCGLPSANCDTRVVKEDGRDAAPGEIGEIIIKSEQMMKEYWKKPELTAHAMKNGWLHTGDLATVDESGYIYLVDRMKDMIVSGGENIYPREVEEVLYTHPAVLECAVIGIPDPKWVEAVHAVVVLKAESEAAAEEIIKYCKQHLAGYKAPKSIEFSDRLPRNPSGKVLKTLLRDKRAYHSGAEKLK